MGYKTLLVNGTNTDFSSDPFSLTCYADHLPLSFDGNVLTTGLEYPSSDFTTHEEVKDRQTDGTECDTNIRLHFSFGWKKKKKLRE